MTTKIKWRLANRPTPGELTELVTAGILTKDEAREILISLETDEDRDKQSLKDEILFLRQLVQSLSNRSAIVQTIKNLPNEVMPWHVQPWYKPYAVWCSAGSLQASGTAGSNQLSGVATGTANTASYSSGSGAGQLVSAASSAPSFNAISTF